MAGIFGGSAEPVSGASLGIDTSMPTMGMPTSVMPLSQQIAGMAQPALSTPTLGGEQRLPSLGVDTSMPTGPQGPGFFSQLGSGLENAAQSFKDVSALMGPTAPPMQFNKLMPARPQVQLQQANLMDFLSMLGGSR